MPATPHMRSSVDTLCWSNTAGQGIRARVTAWALGHRTEQADRMALESRMCSTFVSTPLLGAARPRSEDPVSETEPHLLVERDDHIVTLTMNRPEARNALSAEMLGRMAEAWEQINDDAEIRVVILTGAGGTFCAGADLKALTGRFDDEWGKKLQADPMLAWKGLLRNARCTKPLIAAVEGYCVAGGTEILQSTDI